MGANSADAQDAGMAHKLWYLIGSRTFMVNDDSTASRRSYAKRLDDDAGGREGKTESGESFCLSTDRWFTRGAVVRRLLVISFLLVMSKDALMPADAQWNGMSAVPKFTPVQQPNQPYTPTLPYTPREQQQSTGDNWTAPAQAPNFLNRNGQSQYIAPGQRMPPAPNFSNRNG